MALVLHRTDNTEKDLVRSTSPPSGGWIIPQPDSWKTSGRGAKRSMLASSVAVIGA
jgi:hypothetical protein